MTLEKDMYELVRITERDHIDFTRWQNSQAWQGALSREEYVLRERVLGMAKLTLSSKNRLIPFALIDKQDGRMKASIELLVRESLKFQWDEIEKDVAVKKINSGCIGAVFTYPEYRGKGLARIMVDMLVDMGKKEYVGTEGFTFLYSEVGEYYAKSGFKSFEVPLLKTEFKEATLDARKQLDGGDEIVEMVKYHEFEKLFKLYNKSFKEHTIKKVAEDHLTRVSVDPSLDYVDWFHLRAKFISYHLFHKHKEFDFDSSYEELVDDLSKIDPYDFGIHLQTKEGETIGFVVWTYDWDLHTKSNSHSNSVTLVKVHVQPQFDQINYQIKLINLMYSYILLMNLKNPESKQFNFKSLTIWESELLAESKEVLSKFYSLRSCENGSRSAILLNNTKEEQMLKKGEIIWEENTKLPWF